MACSIENGGMCASGKPCPIAALKERDRGLAAFLVERHSGNYTGTNLQRVADVVFEADQLLTSGNRAVVEAIYLKKTGQCGDDTPVVATDGVATPDTVNYVGGCGPLTGLAAVFEEILENGRY